MRLTVVDHPVVAARLTSLRDENTPTPEFRRLVDDLVTLLAYEATRNVATVAVTVTTPLTSTTGIAMATPPPLVVPVLRAGVGMLDGIVRLLPDAEVGFAGLARDEETKQPTWYADRMPAQAAGRSIYVVDPMLATGGTLIAVVGELLARGADAVTCLCLLVAPEGLAALEDAFPGDSVHVVTAAVDSHLDDNAFIVPGLGDAGDRLFGTAPVLGSAVSPATMEV